MRFFVCPRLKPQFEAAAEVGNVERMLDLVGLRVERQIAEALGMPRPAAEEGDAAPLRTQG